MTYIGFAGVALWPRPIDLGAHAVAGVALGWLYFSAIWWNARHFAARGQVAAIGGLAVARFAVLGAVLAWVSRQGAPPLLATTLGVLVARAVLLRRFGTVTP